MRHQAYQRTLELAHIRADIRRDEKRDIGRKRDPFLLSFLLQDSNLGLEIWRLNIGDESPLKAAA